MSQCKLEKFGDALADGKRINIVSAVVNLLEQACRTSTVRTSARPELRRVELQGAPNRDQNGAQIATDPNHDLTIIIVLHTSEQ